MNARTIRRTALASALALLLPAGALAADPVPVPDGATLVSPFYEILALPAGAGKSAALGAYLAPEFQVLRTTGVRLDAAAYAAEPPAVMDWALVSSVTTADPSGTYAVVSYVVMTDSTIDGVTQTTTAPRLAYFRQAGGTWPMVALANLTAFPAGGVPSPGTEAVGGSAPVAPAASPAPPLVPELAALAAYYDALMLADGPGKAAALDAVLAPEFQVLRTNGRQLDRAAFIAEPALIHTWEIRDTLVTADPSAGVRVVTFTARTDSTIEGVTRTTVAPRIAVLREVDGTWRVAALANLTPPPAPAPSPAG
ncbi:MAG: nuclear transport factor 2 family protein [Chloroflexota bacterium]